MGTRKKNISFEISSTPDQITAVIKKLEDFLAQANVPDEFINEAGLGLSEAVANAIIHGNQLNPHKVVFIQLILDPQRLLMTVTDQGKGFHPDKIPNPLTEENRMKTSGRGIYLIKASIDRVSFKKLATGMQVKLIKYL